MLVLFELDHLAHRNQLGEKGLNDDILSSSPTWQYIEPLVEKILEDKVVISWWMDNEKQFFSNRLKNTRRTLCAMKRFSPLALNYNSNFGDYQNIKLWDAVRYTKTPFPSECRQHRAWIDAEVMRRIGRTVAYVSIKVLFQPNARRHYNTL